MQKTGVKIDSDEIKELLSAEGASVEGNIVKIPSYMIDEALENAPKNITLYNIDGDPVLEIEDDQNSKFSIKHKFYSGSGIGR